MSSGGALIDAISKSVIARGPLTTTIELASGDFNYGGVQAPGLVTRLVAFGPFLVVLAKVPLLRLLAAVGYPCGLVLLAGLAADEWLRGSDSALRYVAALIMALIIVALGACAWSLVAKRTAARVNHALNKWGLPDRVFIVTLVAALLVALFSALAVVLIDIGWVTLREQQNGASAPPATMARCLETFAWLLVGTVPMLELADTFDWTPAVQFAGGWDGLLTLLFRVALLVPVIQIVAGALDTVFKS